MTTHNLCQPALAEVAALAASHGWAEVSEFTAAIPAPGDRGVEILAAADTDPGPLTAWIQGPGGTHQDGDQEGGPACVVSSAGLEPVADRPARALAPNRVLVALRCGQLLTSDAVAAAAAVLARPAGTYRVVLTGAEELESAADLATVERGLWRVLLAPDGAEWHGQDITALGCLLWSGADPADAVRDRVATDVAALREWIAGPVAAGPELDRDRAASALSLAMAALDQAGAEAGQSSAEPADGADRALRARRMADLAAQVRGLHERLLSRLDSDAEVTESQVLASLEVLEQDLVSATAYGRDLPPEQAQRRADLWVAETEQAVVQRYLNSAEQARHLLGRGDWELVNQVAPPPGGDRYPDVLLVAVKPSPTAVLPAGVLAAGAVPAAAGAAIASGWDLPGRLGTVSPRVLVTAGVGAVALGVARVPLPAAASVGLLAVVAGSLYESRHRADHERERADGTGRQPFATAGPLIKEALRSQAKAIKDAVKEQFTTLEDALDKVADQARQAALTPPAGTSAGSDGQLRSRLAALRDQIVLGQEPPDRSGPW